MANRIMRAAAWLAGLVEANSDYTLNLEDETDWLQLAYEHGRNVGMRITGHS